LSGDDAFALRNARRGDVKHGHSRQQGVANAGNRVGRQNPDRMLGVHIDLEKLVLEVGRVFRLQQR